jgi:PIN domain nuclease of toxin-antitoxin system
MEAAAVTYLLDTAVWINGVTLPGSIPRRIRRLLEGPAAKGLCQVSLLETAILSRLGRLTLEGTLQEFFTVGLSGDVALIDVTPAIAAGTNALPSSFPGDPFDRTIISTAAALNLTLITTDRAIRDAEACAVEYYPFKPHRRRNRKR